MQIGTVAVPVSEESRNDLLERFGRFDAGGYEFGVRLSSTRITSTTGRGDH